MHAAMGTGLKLHSWGMQQAHWQGARKQTQAPRPPLA